jgi:leucyl aminopeptidase (aminopeptidase T)
MNRLVLNTLVATGIALAAPIAFAQSTTDGVAARHHAERQAQGERAFRLPSERIEARLAYLKTALKITDAQQAQWEAFASTLRKQAKEMDQRIAARRSQTAESRRDAKPNAIERLERRQARLASASARVSETLAAAKPLYAALNSEQQKIADEVLAPQRRGMRHGHRRGHA